MDDDEMKNARKIAMWVTAGVTAAITGVSMLADHDSVAPPGPVPIITVDSCSDNHPGADFCKQCSPKKEPKYHVD